MFYSYHLIVIILLLVAGKTEGPPQCPGVIQVGQRTFDYACCREVCSTWLFFSSLGISLLVPGCLCLRELVICAEMTRLKDFSSIQTDFWNLHNINTHSAFGGHVLVVIGMVETFHIKRLESVLILFRSHATSVNSEVCSDWVHGDLRNLLPVDESSTNVENDYDYYHYTITQDCMKHKSKKA